MEVVLPFPVLGSSPRAQRMCHWLMAVLQGLPDQVSDLAGDASFRRYYRVVYQSKSYVLMDAPPDKESCVPFVAVAKAFARLSVHVPRVMGESVAEGFLLLEDLGDDLFLSVLTDPTADALYRRAFHDIVNIQRYQPHDAYTMPVFTAAEYRREMDLFSDWYLQKECCYTLSVAEQKVLSHTREQLIAAALAQPQVCVHRDFHSRNLMLLPDDSVGVIDFQDALWGPITYDVMSLLRDCYIDWPWDRVRQWLHDFWLLLLDAGLAQEAWGFESFVEWFDWITLQRNLKCIGLFPRLKWRDGKPEYMQYVPRIFDYALQVCRRHPSLSQMGELLFSVAPADCVIEGVV